MDVNGTQAGSGWACLWEFFTGILVDILMTRRWLPMEICHVALGKEACDGERIRFVVPAGVLKSINGKRPSLNVGKNQAFVP